MLSIPKSLEDKNIYIPQREFISDVIMSRGNRRFLLTNLQAQIWGVTPSVKMSTYQLLCLPSQPHQALL
jgi:hypothetical protein